MKKYLSFLLVLLLLLTALVSCKPSEQLPDDSESDTETENGLVFARAGEQSSYKIIYADGSSKGLKSTLEDMADQINAICQKSLMLCLSASAQRLTEDAPEILVGETNRAESIELQRTLTENYEYIIKAYPNGRIVIVGSNEQMLMEAIAYFAENYVTAENDGYLSVPTDLNYHFKMTDSEAVSKYWKLSLPGYAGGTLSSTFYSTGVGVTMDSASQLGKMQVVSNTTATEFSDYLTLLGEKGYEERYRNEANGCTFVQYYQVSRNRLVYAYYLEALGEARIIEDTNSMLIEDFEYTCADGEAAIYQYGMMCSGDESPYDAINGMFYIIRLADNKLILIDGGIAGVQATDKAVDALLGFMREITGKSEGEKVDIAAYFVTHTHGDHIGFMQQLLSKEEYRAQFNLERLMHNVPVDGAVPTMGAAITEYFPEVKFLKLHTGQNIQLGNVSFDVLFTHEDFVDPRTGATTITEFNNTCTVLKLNINGRAVIITGDWSGGDTATAPSEFAEGQRRLLLMHTNEAAGYNALKADAVQIAHHGLNQYMGTVYKTVGAEYAFIPSMDAPLTIPGHTICIGQFVSGGGDRDNVYFQGRYTYCLSVSEDGEITVAAEQLRGSDTGDDPNTENVTEKHYVNDILSKTDPYRTPTAEELANWAVIHG